VIVSANFLTGTEHPAFSTNRLADTSKTKDNYNQQLHKNF